MKRATIFGLAIALTLALGVTAIQAKPKKIKVETDPLIESFDVGDDTVTFFGQVDADKRKCLKGRTVELEQTKAGIVAGSAKTDEAGSWEITFDQTVAGPGPYQATAARKKVKKRRNGEVKKVFKCRSGVSPTFEAEA